MNQQREKHDPGKNFFSGGGGVGRGCPLWTSLYASKFNVFALDFLPILSALLISSCLEEFLNFACIFAIWDSFCFLSCVLNILLFVFAAFLFF